ncbi:MAG: hypothetical protein ACHREM_00665 [Polyangiales bacterium]
MAQKQIDFDRLVAMTDYKPSHIVSGIYQGSDPPVGAALRAAGVNALVLVAMERQHDPTFFPGVEVMLAPGDDVDNNFIDKAQLKAWHDAAKWAAIQALSGKVVLITCQMGWNRSALVTALAVRYLTGWSGDQSVSVVKMRRPQAFKTNKTYERYVRSLPTRGQPLVPSGLRGGR